MRNLQKKGNRTIEVVGWAGCKEKSRILNALPCQHPLVAVTPALGALSLPSSIHPFIQIYWAPCLAATGNISGNITGSISDTLGKVEELVPGWRS